MFQDNYHSVLFTVYADGDSVNMGRLNGACTQLRFTREWLHNCSNHRLELAIKDACNSDNSFHLIDDVLGVIYWYFCDSGKGKSLTQYLAIQLEVSFRSFERADETQFQNHKYNALKSALQNCFTVAIIWTKCDSNKWSCN